MPPTELWAGALSLLLRHTLTGCSRSASLAADLLERIADSPETDEETRSLCEQASFRLVTFNPGQRPCRPCRN